MFSFSLVLENHPSIHCPNSFSSGGRRACRSRSRLISGNRRGHPRTSLAMTFGSMAQVHFTLKVWDILQMNVIGIGVSPRSGSTGPASYFPESRLFAACAEISKLSTAGVSGALTGDRQHLDGACKKYSPSINQQTFVEARYIEQGTIVNISLSIQDVLFKKHCEMSVKYTTASFFFPRRPTVVLQQTRLNNPSLLAFTSRCPACTLEVLTLLQQVDSHTPSGWKVKCHLKLTTGFHQSLERYFIGNFVATFQMNSTFETIQITFLRIPNMFSTLLSFRALLWIYFPALFTWYNILFFLIHNEVVVFFWLFRMHLELRRMCSLW